MRKADGNKPATKADMAELRNANKADMAELRNANKADLAELRNANKADLAEHRSATKADMTEHRNATKADMAELRNATKADMTEHRNATKADIDGLKADLAEHRSATKADIDGLKTEVKKLGETTNNIASDQSRMRGQMNDMRIGIIAEIRKFSDKLTGSYAESVEKGEMYDRKALSHGELLQAHEAKLREHEGRIMGLEAE